MRRFGFISARGHRPEIESAPGVPPCAAVLASSPNADGSLACGTCHVYVEPAQLARLSPPSAAEDEMLDMTASERRPESRLNCQIVMSDALDGLVLRLPDRQE